MNPDEFAASQREREWFHGLTVPPGLWTVIRVDGRGFSRLTEKHFAKPYDERMREHMTAAATALVTEFGAVYGCTHSDEISVALPPSSGLFGRGLEKLAPVRRRAFRAQYLVLLDHAAGGPDRPAGHGRAEPHRDVGAERIAVPARDQLQRRPRLAAARHRPVLGDLPQDRS